MFHSRARASNAKYKGVGTINGEGRYKFMLTATDGEPDLFRIKIWDAEDDSNVIYDNNWFTFDNDFISGTELGGGNIVIHTVKKTK